MTALYYRLHMLNIQSFELVLLMEEIPNNHLGCIKPCKERYNNYIKWCRVSSIEVAGVSPIVIESSVKEVLVYFAGTSFKPHPQADQAT